MDTCICMTESLGCSSETIITLLIGSIPIQNKKFKNIKLVLKMLSCAVFQVNFASCNTTVTEVSLVLPFLFLQPMLTYAEEVT